MTRRLITPLVVVGVLLGLVALAVLPQLMAHTRGEDYLLRVRPVDPIDPFRGAYVALDYPDLELDEPARGGDIVSGKVYVVLVESDGVWVASSYQRNRPANGAYLSCEASNGDPGCGIDSLFLPQDQASQTGRLLAGGNAVARVRIDSRGHAVVLGVRPR